ncbi:MAG: HD domain-containing protein [Bacteroidales bacterium]|nr:HD domain-containing protein [Bacteroidales bacterium]
MVKEKIISRLRATGRANMENVINYMENNGFFTARCHTHHCHTGGLAAHAWQTYCIAMGTAGDTDSTAISALLHDFCKCGGMGHVHGHGKRSAEMLKALGLHLSSDEYLAIRFHMSLRSHRRHPLYSVANRCKLRGAVHSADKRSAMLH